MRCPNLENTGAGGHFFLQGIFLAQGSNPHLLHCRQILYTWATREALSLRFLLKLILSKITSPSPPHHSLSISSVWISSRNSFQNLYFDFYLFVFFSPTKIGALWWQRFLSVCSALNPQHIRIVLAHVRTMIAQQRNIFVVNAYED